MNRTISGGFARAMVLLVGWAAIVFLIAPILVVLPVSVTPETYLSLPTDSISFRHYAKLVQDPRWSGGIVTSFGIAVLTALCSTVLGTLCATGLWRLSPSVAGVIRSLILWPLIVPPVVHALAFYRTWIDLGWIDTPIGVVVAHTLIATPLVVITVSTSLAGVDRRIEDAARSLGASPLLALRRVVLPSIWPGVLSGAAFAFVTSWDEVVVALFITGRKVSTLPLVIWSSLTERVDPAVAAASSIMIGLTLLLLLVRLWRPAASAERATT